MTQVDRKMNNFHIQLQKKIRQRKCSSIVFVVISTFHFEVIFFVYNFYFILPSYLSYPHDNYNFPSLSLTLSTFPETRVYVPTY